MRTFSAIIAGAVFASGGLCGGGPPGADFVP